MELLEIRSQKLNWKRRQNTRTRKMQSGMKFKKERKVFKLAK
jgi:hypothetical protein